MNDFINCELSYLEKTYLALKVLAREKSNSMDIYEFENKLGFGFSKDELLDLELMGYIKSSLHKDGGRVRLMPFGKEVVNSR